MLRFDLPGDLRHNDHVDRSRRAACRRRPTVTGIFADFAISLNGATLPIEVRRKAGLCLLDFLAACLRARDLDWSRQAIELVRRGGSRGDAAVIGTDLRAAAAEAAFANATAGHGLIREDMHIEAMAQDLAQLDDSRSLAAMLRL